MCVVKGITTWKNDIYNSNLSHMAGNTIVAVSRFPESLWWRHNEGHGVSNHLTIIYTTVYSGADQRKHQSSTSLAFVWEIHQ